MIRSGRRRSSWPKILPGSSAARAGVRVGDVLVAVQNADMKEQSLEIALECIGRAPQVVNSEVPSKEPRMMIKICQSHQARKFRPALESRSAEVHVVEGEQGLRLILREVSELQVIIRVENLPFRDATEPVPRPSPAPMFLVPGLCRRGERVLQERRLHECAVAEEEERIRLVVDECREGDDLVTILDGPTTDPALALAAHHDGHFRCSRSSPCTSWTHLGDGAPGPRRSVGEIAEAVTLVELFYLLDRSGSLQQFAGTDHAAAVVEVEPVPVAQLVAIHLAVAKLQDDFVFPTALHRTVDFTVEHRLLHFLRQRMSRTGTPGGGTTLPCAASRCRFVGEPIPRPTR